MTIAFRGVFEQLRLGFTTSDNALLTAMQVS